MHVIGRAHTVPRAGMTLFVLALVGLLPRPSPAEPAQPPAVDLRHITVSEAGATAPVKGSDERAVLTLDPKLQQASARLLAGANPVAGAVVAADARTGKVLVWVDRSRGRARPGSVLLKRVAPAASLFKIVTAAALLEKAQIPPQTRVCTSGGQRGIERRHLEPPEQGQDRLCAPFSDALGHSRNAVFAQLATRHLMRSDLVDMAAELGFNQAVPFDTKLPFGEVSVPYNDLAFARTAAGFVGSRLSPLGALELAYVIAAGGQTVQPRIVERAGPYRAPSRRRVLRRVMTTWTARHLRRMMEVTVHSGTSLDVFSDQKGRSYLRGIRVAGKTGTLKRSANAPTTTWFVGFAPSTKPRVVVSVLVENGEVWRRKANEVARDVLRAYFADRGAAGVTHPLEND